MSSETTKTAYYYELLRQVRGNHKNLRQSQRSLPSINKAGTKNQQYKYIIGRPFKWIYDKLLSHLSIDEKKSYPLVRISFKKGKLEGKEFFIYNVGADTEPTGYMKIGRSNKEDLHFINVPSRMVSRLQASIICLDDRLLLANHSKVNPTQVNGRAVALDQYVGLPDGARVVMGDVEFMVEKIKKNV
jgi:hypothetical protein